VFRLGGNIVFASFAPRTGKLLVASSNGKVGLFDPRHGRLAHLTTPAPLTAAAWSPDGKTYALGTLSGDVLSKQTIHAGAAVKTLAYAGKTLLVASGSKVLLEDGSTRKERTVSFSGTVLAAALDPSASVFAVAFAHGKHSLADLVDAHTGRVIRRLPEQGIESFAFSPNGKLLATGSSDLTARLWDARTGRLIHVLPHRGHVLQESFSHDGTRLVTASSDGAAYVWGVATGQRELLLVGATGAISSAAFSPDGSEIVTGSSDRLARLYQASNGLLLATLGGSGNAITSVGFDPKGKTVVTASSDGTVRLWDAQPAGTATTIDTRKTPVRSFWLGQNVVTVAGNVARELTPSGHVIHTRRMDAPIVASASQGDHLALLDADGVVATSWGIGFDVATGRSRTTAVGLEPDGTLLRGKANGAVIVGRRRVSNVGGPVLALSVGGSRFLVRIANEVRVYTDLGELVTTLHAATDHAILSPGGLGVATSKGKVAQIWDATTGKLLHTLSGHGSAITALAYSPNGLDVVTASDDHTGIIWSTRSGHLVRRLIGHFFPIYAVSWSPDGHWIVTASQYTAGLWNAASGQLMFYVGRAGAPLTGAAFSPHGDWIATGSLDGTARVYHCLVCQPLDRLEALATVRLGRLR
jgi:WD40 repeat protein